MKKFFISIAAIALLTACTSEEEVGTPIVSEPETNIEVADAMSVTLDNGTSVDVGNSSALLAKSQSGTGDNVTLPYNMASEIEMPEMPDATADLGTTLTEDRTIYDITEQNVTVTAGVTATLDTPDSDKASMLSKTIYVFGTLNINAEIDNAYLDSIAGTEQNGQIIVYPGGVLNLNGNKGSKNYLDNVSVYNYGGTINVNVNELFLEERATFMTDGDLTCNSDKPYSQFNIGAKNVYIGGNLNFNEISMHSGAALRVVGDINTKSDISLHGGSYLHADGGIVTAGLSLGNGSKVFAGCKVVTNSSTFGNINVYDGSVIVANYVLCDRSVEIRRGNSDWTGIILSDGGVIDTRNLGFRSDDAIAVYGDGTAVVQASEKIWVNEELDGKKLVGDNVYVNCFADEISEYNGLSPYFQIDDDRFNVATINADNGNCNPGFTVIGRSDDIFIKIPDEIDDKWFIEADDFAIRIDGIYQEIKPTSVNGATLDGVMISEDELVVRIGNLDNIEVGREYTYETWIWVSDKTWGVDDSTNVTAVFTDEMKAEWVSGDGNGTDITPRCTVIGAKGYDVRYEIYRGLSGHADTPYIKVSVHVTKTADGQSSLTAVTKEED